VYCGVRPGTTADHVPPKNIFPSPRPDTLITVPCCEDCRRTQSVDDEYFRTMLALRQDVAANPTAEQIVDSVERALQKPQKARFSDAILRSAQKVSLWSPSGLYAGTGHTFNVDTRRLDSVVRRTMLGLHYRETNHRVPDGYEPRVYCVDAFTDLSIKQAAEVQRLVDVATSGSRRSIGERVFAYWYQSFADKPEASVWAFLFYTRVLFIGFVLATEKTDEA
jgi:hypothetical protein